MICDGCNLGFHTFCLDPPLSQVPDGPFYCPTCVVEEKNQTETDLIKRKRSLILEEEEFSDNDSEDGKPSDAQNIYKLQKQMER